MRGVLGRGVGGVGVGVSEERVSEMRMLILVFIATAVNPRVVLVGSEQTEELMRATIIYPN